MAAVTAAPGKGTSAGGVGREVEGMVGARWEGAATGREEAATGREGLVEAATGTAVAAMAKVGAGTGLVEAATVTEGKPPS